MGTTAEQSQHPDGISLVHRFPKDLIPHNHHCIRRDDQFIRRNDPPVGICLLLGDIAGHLIHGQIVRIVFVDILKHTHLKGHSQPCKQFLPPGRMTRQHQLIVHYHPKALAFITHFPWARSTCSITSRPHP